MCVSTCISIAIGSASVWGTQIRGYTTEAHLWNMLAYQSFLLGRCTFCSQIALFFAGNAAHAQECTKAPAEAIVTCD